MKVVRCNGKLDLEEYTYNSVIDVNFERNQSVLAITKFSYLEDLNHEIFQLSALISQTYSGLCDKCHFVVWTSLSPCKRHFHRLWFYMRDTIMHNYNIKTKPLFLTKVGFFIICHILTFLKWSFVSTYPLEVKIVCLYTAN